MSSRVRDAVLIILLAVLVLFGNLGGTKLWDEDEPRNARCAIEMMDRGDLVVPTFNGELRTHKPVLLYWLMIVSYHLLGITEFASRLPSALCGLGTVICVWLCGRRLFGARAGLLAAVILLTTLMFDVAARAATPDSVYIFFMTLGITIFVRSTVTGSDVNRPDSETQAAEVILGRRVWFPSHPLSIAAFYLALGLAILAKGPIGFLLPMAILGMFLLIMRRSVDATPQPFRDGDAARRDVATPPRFRLLRMAASWFAPNHFLKTLWSMRPLTGTVISLAAAVPWYYAVGYQTQGEWLRGFFLEHHLGRATSAMENHSGPFLLYYVAAIIVGFFPWSVFLVPSLLDARKRHQQQQRWHPGIVLAVCWIAVPVVLFSCASTKLPSYVTPGYPGLALLVGTFLDRLAASRVAISSWWVRAGFLSAFAVGVLLVFAGGFAVARLFPGEYLLLVPGAGLLIGAWFSFRCFEKKRRFHSLGIYVGGAAAFVIGLFQIAAPQVSEHQQIESLFAAAETPEADFATFEVMQSSWVFYANQTLERFHADRIEPLRDFLADQPSHFVIAKASRASQLAEDLGFPLATMCRIPWFLKNRDHDLVLLRASPQGDVRHGGRAIEWK